MLQDIRTHIQGTLAKIFVGLIVVAFAFWGVQSILLGGGSHAVAEVNGEEIGPAELNQAVNVEKRRMIAAMGDNFDPSKLDDDTISQQALQGLISRKLMVQAATELGLKISDRQVGAIIGGMQQFQVDGQFSEELYRAALGDAGYSPLSFKRAVADDILLSQLRSGLGASDFATPAELSLDARIVIEQRDLRYLAIPLQSYRAGVAVSDQDIEAYYRANPQQFYSKETVELDYIELTAEQFRQPVDEQRLQEAYDQEIHSREYQTENRVSHILLMRKEGESADDYQQRIADLQARLASGGDFAQMARQYSDDPGSANSGGDLGYSTGDVFPETMEKAIAGLTVGKVSAPVVTDAGTHFVLLTERREVPPPSFEELRPQLEDQLAMPEARSELLRTVETLKDLAFNAEDLQGPAAELGLEVSHSGPVTREQGEGLFAKPALISAAFSPDVLDNGHNSDVIELGQDDWVVLRVRQHHLPEALPLAAVHDQIAALLTDQRARAAVEQAAESAVAALRAGETVEAYAQTNGLDWQVELGVDRRNTTLPRELLAQLFQLRPPEAGQAVVDFVPTAAGDVYVYEFTRVSPGDFDKLSPAEQNQLRNLATAEYAQLVDREYRQGLRQSAKISMM